MIDNRSICARCSNLPCSGRTCTCAGICLDCPYCPNCGGTQYPKYIYDYEKLKPKSCPKCWVEKRKAVNLVQWWSGTVGCNEKCGYSSEAIGSIMSDDFLVLTPYPYGDLSNHKYHRLFSMLRDMSGQENLLMSKDLLNGIDNNDSDLGLS